MTNTMISEVYNMDCIEGMKQYPDNHFDLAIVDPPYGIDVSIAVGKLAVTIAERPKITDTKELG
jgi:DNA modification methylase